MLLSNCSTWEHHSEQGDCSISFMKWGKGDSYNTKLKSLKQTVDMVTFPILGWEKQKACSEFEANLYYIVSSRPSIDTLPQKHTKKGSVFPTNCTILMKLKYSNAKLFFLVRANACRMWEIFSFAVQSKHKWLKIPAAALGSDGTNILIQISEMNSKHNTALFTVSSVPMFK